MPCVLCTDDARGRWRAGGLLRGTPWTASHATNETEGMVGRKFAAFYGPSKSKEGGVNQGEGVKRVAMLISPEWSTLPGLDRRRPTRPVRSELRARRECHHCR